MGEGGVDLQNPAVTPITARLKRAYPFLAALFPPLALYAHNQRFYRLPEALFAMAGSLLVTTVLWLLALLLWRDADRRAFALFILVICFHLSGHAISHIGGMPIVVLGREMDLGAIAAWSVALLGVALLACRLPAEGKSLTSTLALFSLVLVLIPLARITKLEVQRLARQDLDFQGGGWSAVRNAPQTTAPHIFYVILDSYGRQDVLATYGFDNAPFLEALRERGFYVASRSESVSVATASSLAGSLNMSYRDGQSREAEIEEDSWSANRAINHGRVVRMLHERGYSFAAFANGYGMVEARMADVFLDVGARWNLDGKFFQTALDLTALRALAPRWNLGRTRIESLHRARVLFALERAPELASSRGPVFAFVHIVCPHEPFVFDARGNTPPPLNEPRGWTPEKERAYIEQVKYLNGRVLQMVDAILATAVRPVVIVLQGDHGPGKSRPLDERRLKILNAYLFPDRQYHRLSDATSPVNTFRIILSQYLDFDIPLLPDRRRDAAHPVSTEEPTDDPE